MAYRKAYTTTINQLTGLGTIRYMDNRGSPKPNVIMTQPYVGRGWGIRVGVEENSAALVDDGPDGQAYIIGYLPDQKFMPGAPAGTSAENTSAPSFASLNEGEIVLQSLSNSTVLLDDEGSITLKTADNMRFELSTETDTINQISVNQVIYTEGVSILNGLVRRDTRTLQQQNNDLFISTLVGFDFSGQQYTDIIGVDPQYQVTDQDDTITGVYDSTTGTPSISTLAGVTGIPQSDTIVSQVLNPALTEYHIVVNEFSDGLTNLTNTQQTPDAQKAGYLPPGLLGKFVLGTVVNDSGIMPRFDYVFGSGSSIGHGNIWTLPSVNETGISVDFKIDSTIAIGTITPLGNQTQWTVNNLQSFNTSIAFQLLLNSRGADSGGNILSGSSTGSQWSLQVDKEGLTKWNIPAATSLNNVESFRAGRSLLWNMDGSITVSAGSEQNLALPNVTGGSDPDTGFVNVLPGRTDRSWTSDFLGSMEVRLGADSAGQSYMIQADGGLAFYYGQMTASEPSVVGTIKTAGLTAPSVSQNRAGTSISGRTAGSIDLDLGANDSLQSIALNAAGIIAITVGSDDTGNSLNLSTEGNIILNTVNGGHKFEIYSTESSTGVSDMIRVQHGGLTQSLFQIDSNGVIILRNSLANSNIIMSALGDITLINAVGSKISLALDGTIGIGGATAGIDISPTGGITLRTVGGSIGLTLEGKVNISTNAGLTVTGSQAHLNTTGVLFGPTAATSPFRVAICGGGLGIDPITGTSQTGFSLLGAIG